MNSNKYVCAICREEHDGFGNNPAPVVTDIGARCCDRCNATKVIQARIEALRIVRKIQDGKQ